MTAPEDRCRLVLIVPDIADPAEKRQVVADALRGGDVDDALARYEILKPEEIAASFVAVHRQGRSAWTHELDLRPWKETW